MTIPVYYPDITSSTTATSVVVVNTAEIIDTAAFNTPNFPLLTSVIFMDDSICTTLGYGAFVNSQLTSLVLPDSIINVGQAVCKSMTKLTSITLGQNTPSISDYMFQECPLLTSIQIPNSATTIGQYSFHNCYLLNQVLYSSAVTSIAAYAFRNCLALTKFVVLSSVITIDSTAFTGCTNLIKVVCFNPSLMAQLTAMLPNAIVQSYDEMILGVEQVTYVNKLQNTIVYGRFQNSDDVTARNIQCNAVFDRNVNVDGNIVNKGSLTVDLNATIAGTVWGKVLKQDKQTLAEILAKYQLFETGLGKTYSKEYTATLIKSGIGKVTSQLYTQNITLPVGCWKIDVTLFGSGGLSGTRTVRCGEGVGSGGNVVYIRNLMLIAGTVFTLNIRAGMNNFTTDLLIGGTYGTIIASAMNGNNGTNAGTTVVGVSGLKNIASWGSVNTFYSGDYYYAYASSGQPPPNYIGITSAVLPYKGGYAAGNGFNTTPTAYTGIVSSSYGSGSIGGGMSSMIEYQVSPLAIGYKYDPTYKSGGAIITYYLK